MTTSIIIAQFIVGVFFVYKWLGERKRRKNDRALSVRIIAGLHEDIVIARAEIYVSYKDYQALEQGMAEQEENYEMQFLTFGETIERLEKENTDLKAVTEFHEGFCLPNLPLVK